MYMHLPVTDYSARTITLLQSDLYTLWDLHIRTYMTWCGRVTFTGTDHTRVRRRGWFLQTYFEKTKASLTQVWVLGTPVEQPSPRTAQPQIRFVSDQGKWLPRARRRALPGQMGRDGTRAVVGI